MLFLLSFLFACLTGPPAAPAAAKDAEGLPSYFNNFRRLLGSRTLPVRRGRVDAGDIVESR